MSDLTNAEKRAIWVDCYCWTLNIGRHCDLSECSTEALRRYPDPTVTRSVMLSCGQYRIATGELQEFMGRWRAAEIHAFRFTPDDLVKLGDLAQEYSERTK